MHVTHRPALAQLLPLILIVSLLAALSGACMPTSSVTPAPSPSVPARAGSPTLEPAATATHVLTATPTQVPSIIPTPMSVDSEGAALLIADPHQYCPRFAWYGDCIGPLGFKILDYLYQHPETPYRKGLTKRLLDLAGYSYPSVLPLEWLIEDWLDASVRRPFEVAGGLPPGFAEQWREWGQVFETDLDGNGDPDYLLTFRLGALVPGDQGRLYWLHREFGKYQLAQLATSQPTIKAVRDLNGDGRTDVAYSTSHCGASTCFEYLHIFSWKDDAWRSILIPDGWSPQNGGWVIQDRKDGTAELSATTRGTGSAGFGPFFRYNIHFLPIHGEFVPVMVSPEEMPQEIGEGGGDVIHLEWAQKLAYSHRFTESLEILTAVVEKRVGSNPWIDYTPYALFRLGMTHLFLRDVTTAQQVWGRLVATFPDHPVSRDVAQVRTIVQRPEDVWRVCSWLYQNHKTQIWPPPEMTSGKAGNIPTSYGAPLSWRDVCHPLLLMPLWTWTRQEPLEAQAARFDLSWQLLSADYDLNGDGLPDPIGVLNIRGARSPWAFLSDGDFYRPLFVAQPFPLGAIQLDDYSTYSSATEYQEIRLTDLDGNHQPEILMISPYRFMLWEWVGHRFRLPSVQSPDSTGQFILETIPDGKGNILIQRFEPQVQGEQVTEWVYRLKKGVLTRVSPPAVVTPSPFAGAMAALFRDAKPGQALAYLEHFEPTPSIAAIYSATERAAVRYLRALALKYAGYETEAQTEFTAIEREFPDTGWALLAREKLQ